MHSNLSFMVYYIWFRVSAPSKHSTFYQRSFTSVKGFVVTFSVNLPPLSIASLLWTVCLFLWISHTSYKVDIFFWNILWAEGNYSNFCNFSAVFVEIVVILNLNFKYLCSGKYRREKNIFSVSNLMFLLSMFTK